MFQRPRRTKHVDFLPLTNDRRRRVGGSTTLFEGLSVRYDTRANREYCRRASTLTSRRA